MDEFRVKGWCGLAQGWRSLDWGPSQGWRSQGCGLPGEEEALGDGGDQEAARYDVQDPYRGGGSVAAGGGAMHSCEHKGAEGRSVNGTPGGLRELACQRLVLEVSERGLARRMKELGIA